MNPAFVFTLSFGIVIAVANVALVAAPYSLSDNFATLRSGLKGECPPSFFGNWIGATPFTITTSIFYYALPLIACIPYATSLCSDISSNFADQLISRKGRLHYFAAKLLAIVLVCGATTVIPLLINIIAVACLLPQIMPDPTTFMYAVMASTMLAELFYAQPWCYIALFLAMTFIGSGIFGLVSTVLALYVRNIFIVVLAPFMLCVAVQLATQNTSYAGFAPLNVLLPAQPYPSIFWVVTLAILATLAILVIFLLVKGVRYEDI